MNRSSVLAAVLRVVSVRVVAAMLAAAVAIGGGLALNNATRTDGFAAGEVVVLPTVVVTPMPSDPGPQFAASPEKETLSAAVAADRGRM
ncbi:MAG TPA: hypothetical protein VFR86_26360 [Burkholderiaceae bacterium]|nr:hypothetical protein [Burkholderiaceae bacterium]